MTWHSWYAGMTWRSWYAGMTWCSWYAGMTWRSARLKKQRLITSSFYRLSFYRLSFYRLSFYHFIILSFYRSPKSEHIVSQKANLEIGKTPIFHLFLLVFKYTELSHFLV